MGKDKEERIFLKYHMPHWASQPCINSTNLLFSTQTYFFFFSVLGFELRASSLSHSVSSFFLPFCELFFLSLFVMGFFPR
jgi:hypothetical protein